MTALLNTFGEPYNFPPVLGEVREIGNNSNLSEQVIATKVSEEQSQIFKAKPLKVRCQIYTI